MDKSKNFVIGALLVAIMVMSVGYALLAQTLTINGTGKIDAHWDVHFLNDIAGTFEKASNSKNDGGQEILPTSSGVTATFSADLNEPGAKATYTVTIKNAGTIDARLQEITDLTAKNAETPAEITFSVSGVNVGDTLKAGESAVVTVVVEWPNDNADEEQSELDLTVSKTVAIALKYVQA